MSYDDFRPSPIDSVRPRENASQLARRMAEMGSSPKPAHGRLPGGGNISRPPPLMGEIVEVEGGHIVRSTGRKDRHSKVYTAKGPRDRRVRLSANTAIQFYDLQDRLGYDRPSKAVAWLIEKAKASIDELARLPEARPPTNEPKPADKEKDHSEESEAQSSGAAAAAAASSIRADQSRAIARERARERAKERTQGRDAVAKAVMENNTANNIHCYLNTRGNNMFSNINATNSLIQAMNLQTAGQTVHAFEVGMPPSDSNSRSLHLQASQLPQQQPSRQQTFYQSLLAQTSQALQNFSSQFDAPPLAFTPADNSAMGRDHHIQTQTQQGLFNSSAASAFQVPSSAAAAAAFVRGIATMSEQQHHHHHEFGGGQQPRSILRASWNNNNSNNDITTTAAPDFGPFGNHVALNIRGSHQYHQQNSFTARGTLQSSSSPVRVRPMPLAQDRGAADQLILNSTAAASTSSGSGFSGFRIPARIQGIDEHDDVKPSAASSNSHL